MSYISIQIYFLKHDWEIFLVIVELFIVRLHISVFRTSTNKAISGSSYGKLYIIAGSNMDLNYKGQAILFLYTWFVIALALTPINIDINCLVSCFRRLITNKHTFMSVYDLSEQISTGIMRLENKSSWIGFDSRWCEMFGKTVRVSKDLQNRSFYRLPLTNPVFLWRNNGQRPLHYLFENDLHSQKSQLL